MKRGARLKTSKPLVRKTPMRQVSDKKAAEWASGEAKASSTIARRPVMRAVAAVKPKRLKLTGPSDAVVRRVLDRDGDSCVRCGLGLSGDRGTGWSVHHRKLRSQGGDNSLSNLVALCGHGSAGCHGYAHARPTRARREGGWILRSTDDPASYPVVHALRGFVFLDADGGWSQSHPEGVAA